MAQPPRCQLLSSGEAGQATGSALLVPAAAATSAAKSSTFFSMPSPSWKRTKLFSVIGAPVALKGFARFALGEGIDKKETDFAAEVAAQLKS
jgi:hypothetical protein